MKIKEFWKNNKKLLMVGGTIVVGTAVFLITKDKGFKFEAKEKSSTWWTGDDNGIPLNIEKVKDFLELNKDSSSRYAIFREGPDPNKYVIILLSDDVVLP